MILESMQKWKTEKRNLQIVWLDLDNAYGRCHISCCAKPLDAPRALYVFRGFLDTLYDLEVHDEMDRPPGGYSIGIYSLANPICHGHTSHP